MINRTLTAVLDAPKDDVFEYLSRIENLPDWATEFAQELRFEDGKAKVVNGLGEFYFRIDADPDTGVIDMYASQDDDQVVLFPARVVSLGPTKCAFSFTMFKAPETPDELFEAQYDSLRREFDHIRARFAGKSANCST